jgi:hypothetical protein
MFSPDGYRNEADDLRSAVESGRDDVIIKQADKAAKKSKGVDAILYTLEEGRLRSLAGDVDGSIRVLQSATDVFEKERQEPVVRASRAFFSAAAIATNDRLLPYESSGFERLAAQNLLALNFLRKGQADFAKISLNAGIAEMDYQREREKFMQKELDSGARQNGLSSDTTMSATAKVREQLSASARPGLSAYQSAFTFYLSSVLFELQGDRSRSEIAMRRAGELYPEHPEILSVLADGWRSHPDNALVVALVSDGWVPLKESIALPLFWNGTILQVVMPFYGSDSSRWGQVGSALMVDGDAVMTPVVISDLSAQARQHLADKYPAIFLRQALRLISKYQIQQGLERENQLAGFAAQIVNLLTDHADLRSWSTLPGTMQVAHTNLPPGPHYFNWSGRSGSSESLEFDLPAGSTLFLIVDKTRSYFSQDWILFDKNGKLLLSTFMQPAHNTP